MKKGKLVAHNNLSASPRMSFHEVIELGEYDPKLLSTYDEWSSMSPHVQLQMIRKGMDNRRRQLLVQWADLDRAIDARVKPGLAVAKKNIEKQLRKIEDDRERYYQEFTSKM